MPQRRFYRSRGEQVASRAIGRCPRFLYRSNDADLKRQRPISQGGDETGRRAGRAIAPACCARKRRRRSQKYTPGGVSFLNWDTEIPSVNLTAWVVPGGPHRLLATCIGEFVPGSGAPMVAHTATPIASANSTVFVAILSPDILRRLSCVSAANLKNYAAGPEMVCPGGALSFPALGP